jgi:hypothetical protein
MWSFKLVITGLYDRFVHHASVGTAVDKFWNATYVPEEGIMALYHELTRHAARMVRPPDRYTFKSHLVMRMPSTMFKSLFDVKLRSGQIFSLNACCAVGPWLAGDPNCSVHLWFVPSRLEWGVQKQAHDAAVALKIAVGRRPRTSRDFMLQHFDVEATKAWHERFKDPSYRGHSFLDLKGSKGRPLQPSTRKGGPWMFESAFGTAAFSRLCRCITGHAPLGEYRLRFKLHGVVQCLCQHGLYGPLETRGHALYACCLRTQPNPVTALDTIPMLSEFIEVNPSFCAFAPSTVAWDPG